MSIQNPERLATKQDLKDMYDRIRPYMGGLPEVVANKFSKGDLYDTSEKMIGKWINGKPVYQRIFTGATPVITPTSRTEYWFYENEMPTNIDTICKIDGYMTLIVSDKYPSDVGKDTNYCPLAYSDMGNGNFYIATHVYSNLSPNNHRGVRVFARMDSQWFAFSPTVILQYTKNTDSANSFNIGEATDYSTEEKIIGTWLSGEPIYQKTVSCGGLVNNAEKTVAHGISNLDKYMVVGGYAGNSSGGSRPVPYVSSNGTGIGLDVDTTNIYIDCRGYNWSGLTESYITLQYTKSNS